MRLDTVKLILTIISGLSWTIVYLEAIRLGLRERTFAIPFYALALNLAWEAIQSIIGVQQPMTVQTTINLVWLVLDLGVFYTYFKFGRRYFPSQFSGWFIGWSILVITLAFWVEYAFVKELGAFVGGAYAAFLQNLLMSVFFIHMFLSRGGREGQSVILAVAKWLGTLAPTVTFGVLGNGQFHEGSFLILILGTFCCVFDVIYIWLLTNKNNTLPLPRKKTSKKLRDPAVA